MVETLERGRIQRARMSPGRAWQRPRSLGGEAADNVPSPASANRLARLALIAGDAIVVAAAFVVPLLLLVDIQPNSAFFWVVEPLLILGVTLVAIRYQGLWSPRVLTMRMLEFSRLPRAFVVASILVMILDRKASFDVRGWDLLVASAIAVSVMILWRSAYRVFVAAERRNGRLTSRVVLIGSGRRAFELRSLFNVHRELGMRAVGIIGDRDAAIAAGCGHLWAGSLCDAPSVVERLGADVVVVCSVDLDEATVRRVTHGEWARGRALFVDAGLPGVDFRRVRATAIAHQPLVQLDRPTLPALEQWLKRAFDVVVASLMLLVTLPITLAIAALIKLEDRGPVLFCQSRVGRYGRQFKIFKFRTMHIDAEQRLAEVMAHNERHGPLFKMADSADPRITRVGRLLRASSLDELPQLLNVLRGEMSLVGPRPALPKEVEKFPTELLARHEVRPGITGLWQVEARDNSEFEAYRRLDLFYVENWSLAFDAMIMIATAVEHVLLRPVVGRLYRGERDESTEADAAAVANVPMAS